MNPSMEPQAFGAGRAGSAFDAIEFLKKPQVILRIVAWVCLCKDFIHKRILSYFSRFSLLLSLHVLLKKDMQMINAATMVLVLVDMVLLLA